MALIIPTGFAQVILPFQHAGMARAAAITYAVDVTEASGDYTQVCDDQVVKFTNAWDGELDSEVTIGPATIRVGQDGGDPLSVEGSFTDVGTETGGMQPPNTNLLVKKQTALGGRRGRGRCFIPWVLLDAAVNDVGQIDGGSLTARQAAADLWLENLTGNSPGTYESPMYLLHDTRGAGTEPAPTLVTALVCDSLVAVQNRRIGRG